VEPSLTPRLWALAAIRAYQRVISPHKGFVCAYRVHTGRCSCSELGYRAIRRFGVGKGWLVLRERTARCGVAHRRHTSARPRPPARERGDCALDLPCDLDLTPSPGKPGLCDVFSCCDAGSCDWPDRKKKRQAGRRVHIPPYADRKDRQRKAQ
jgi:putative component of membrane protein insertase Oxa1/YidC/SpoIIIJ protein YidD